MTDEVLTRECSAIACPARIRRGLFMCIRHWHMLQPALRSSIWVTHRAWRLGGSKHEHILNLKRAQLLVARVEGRTEYVVTLQQTVDKMRARQLGVNNEANS